MKPTASVITASSVILLSACSGVPANDNGEWKEVTKTVAGNVVTYKVPVTREVPGATNVRDLSEFENEKKKTAQADPNAGSAEVQNKAAVSGAQGHQVAAADSAPGVAQTQQKPPKVGVQAPFFTQPHASAISEDAEVALGQAEILVRDAQSRFETAQAALSRARDAARDGDSVSVIKFSKTAQALARPSP
jgi:hypothetical protein